MLDVLGAEASSRGLVGCSHVPRLLPSRRNFQRVVVFHLQPFVSSHLFRCITMTNSECDKFAGKTKSFDFPSSTHSHMPPGVSLHSPAMRPFHRADPEAEWRHVRCGTGTPGPADFHELPRLRLSSCGKLHRSISFVVRRPNFESPVRDRFSKVIFYFSPFIPLAHIA